MNPPVPVASDAIADALEDLCLSAECAAGCDEGCTEDEAYSEILLSMGSAMGVSYLRARAALTAHRNYKGE